MVYRSRHRHPALRDLLEADAAVVGLIADQQHQAMAFRLGVPQRVIEQRPAAPRSVTSCGRLDDAQPTASSPDVAAVGSSILAIKPLGFRSSRVSDPPCVA